MARKYLTTTQVAVYFDVTPDTVLKWVKSGRIPSIRTPGGHCRISRKTVEKIVPRKLQDSLDSRIAEQPACWEFHAEKGDINPEVCEGCLICRSQAQSCWILSRFLRENHLAEHSCPGQCETCSYFALMNSSALVADSPREPVPSIS